MKRRASLLLVGVFAFAAVASDACTPAQRAALPAEERAVCVLLRAADPRIEPYCATADELAPFVAEIIAASKEPAPAMPPAPAPAVVAFAMPAPRRSAPRRHCVQWVRLDADAGAETGAP